MRLDSARLVRLPADGPPDRPAPPAGGRLRGGSRATGRSSCSLLAGVALIVAEFLTYREIVAVTVVPEGGRTTGGAHHGYALALIGLVSLPMSYGAVLGGSRPAAAALAVLGALALAIAAIVDLPSLDDTGLIGRTYDLAEASPAVGFWIEIVAAAVLLAAGCCSCAAARSPRASGATRGAASGVPARRRGGGGPAAGSTER